MGADRLMTAKPGYGSPLRRFPFQRSSAKYDGIFPELVDRRAFFDRVVLTIRGRRKKLSGTAVINRTNLPIGGEKSHYARVERGVVAATGNSFDLRYGPLRLQKIVPPLVLVLRSDRTPISAENALAAVKLLCEKGWTASVSQVEITFDLTGTSVGFFERNVLTPARRFKTLGEGRLTHYIGGRTSPWQIRVYDKAPGLVRFEFVGRRAFLRAHGIHRPAHLVLLRDIDLRPRVQLRELDKGQMKTLEESIDEDYRRRVLARWDRDLPLRVFLPAVKKYFSAVPDELVVPSPVEERLRRMQWQLVWDR